MVTGMCNSHRYQTRIKKKRLARVSLFRGWYCRLFLVTIYKLSAMGGDAIAIVILGPELRLCIKREEIQFYLISCNR